MLSRAALFLLGTCITWVLTAVIPIAFLPEPHAHASDKAPSFPGSSHERQFGPAVHVITTRFGQRQPSLLALGHARLQLFRTFCLPSMIHQSSQDFLWMILVDPELNTDLLEELKQLVAPYQHFYVLRSNEYALDLRLGVDPSIVESGDILLLQRGSQASKSKIIIETSLDADDGLHPNILPLIHQLSVDHLHKSRLHDDDDDRTPQQQHQHLTKNQHSSDDWVAFCIERHFEWHLGNITDTSSPGVLAFVRKDICVMAGLTFARGPAATRSDLPKGGHHMLKHTIDSCHNDTSRHCLHRLLEIGQPQAIRARTPTSAGMADVTERYEQKKAATDMFWEFLQEAYTIEKEQVLETKQYLQNHLVDIVNDNLAGQCTKGHSCKQITKEKLLGMLKDNNSKQ